MNKLDRAATVACVRRPKKAGCLCITCTARMIVFGVNIPVPMQEEARMRAAREGIDLKVAARAVLDEYWAKEQE